MRSLLFYQEQKMKKAAKIKSKAYHRIKKKEKQKKEGDLSLEELQELDPEMAAEERLKYETERARERVTLRHKNTGKWARRMLQRGSDVNSETKQAIIDQLNQHERLRRKIQDVEEGDSEGDAYSDDNEFNDTEEMIRAKAIEQLDQMENKIDESEKPRKGIFAMKFMQRALENQKNKTKQDLEDLKKELEEEKELRSDYDSDNSNNEKEKEEKNVKSVGVGRMVISKVNFFFIFIFIT